MQNNRKSLGNDIAAPKTGSRNGIAPKHSQVKKHADAAPDVGLSHFVAHFIGSTIGRSSILLGGALGAFGGTIVLYFLSINRGVIVDSYLILAFTLGGIALGIMVDLVFNLILFARR